MKTTLRKIGNSKGIILPLNILKECSIDYEINIEVSDKKIVISAASDSKRKNWAEAFKKMAQANDDKLIIPDLFEDENINDNWTWK